MVDTIFPTPNATGYTPRQGRQAIAAGFGGATASRPLGTFSGVRPGTPATTVTANTTTVTCQAFGGVADPQTAGQAGPYEFAFDASTTFALNAQSASVPRSDIVYVQFNDNQEDGTGATNSSSATRVYLAGSTVTVPSPPNTRTMVIAIINVPIVGSSPTVTWVAPYCFGAGGVGQVYTFSALPASGGLGDKITANDTQITYRWNGSAWKAWESDWITYAPTLTPGSGAFNSASATMSYKYVAGMVVFTCSVTIANFGTAGGGLTVSLPVAVIGTWNSSGRSEITGKQLQARMQGGSASLFVYDNTSPSAANGLLTFSGTYQI